jgi:hypothetical protein
MKKMEASIVSLHVIIDSLRRILPKKNFEGIVVYIIGSMIIDGTKDEKGFHLPIELVNEMHRPKIDLISSLMVKEDVRWPCRLFIMKHYRRCPPELDLWQRMNQDRDREREVSRMEIEN